MSNFFDASQRELDLLLLAAVVFMPALFAMGLFVIPARKKEFCRWWALFGTAITLALTLCVFVDYYDRVLSFPSDRSVRTMYHPSSRLDVRSDAQSVAANSPTPGAAFLSHDLVVRRAWIEPFDAYFALGVDGINLALVLLTGLVMFTAIIASWKIEKNIRGYLALMLLLQTGVTGAFLSLDFFLFYVFYELMLFPMYFLVGLWGGPRRKYAAGKFVVYTLLGGVGILAAMIALHSTNARDFVDQNLVRERANELRRSSIHMSMEEAWDNVEVHTFDLATLTKMGRASMLVLQGQESRIGVKKDVGDMGDGTPGGMVNLLAPGVSRAVAMERFKNQSICTKNFQYIVFALLFFGFAVKVPLIPLHSWLPDAHVEAPTPVSMVLAGVLLKLGGYGLIRMAWPICPWAAHELAWAIGLLGVIGIAYGALVAMGQTDMKKLLAYSSISHMGYVVLGLAAWGSTQSWHEWGATGAMVQMVAHGITATALFFAVGIVYDRAHHRDLTRLGGLTESMPAFTGLSAILFFASMGLPGLCGFVGELFVMVGTWAFSPSLAVPAIFCTILTAAYLLWAWQRMYLGTNTATARFPDVSAREAVVLFIFVVIAIALGVAPKYFLLSWMEPAVSAWASDLSAMK